MGSFFTELKRRNVFKVAVAYAIVAWVVLQVADVISQNLGLPIWFPQVVTALLVLGFPMAMLFAWAFELTPEGVKPTATIAADKSITQSTGKKLNLLIISTMALAIVFLVLDGYLLVEEPEITVESESELAIVGEENGQGAEDQGGPGLVIEEQQKDVLPNSIAVLPFANLSPDPDNAYFAAGIHDTVLHELVKISGLNVIARTTMLQYSDGQTPIAEVAKALNVQTVMEGSVQYAADQVRITAQLIDPATDAHIWSGNYDRPFADIFAIQTEIAVNIARALEAELLPAEQQSMNLRPTNSEAAYALYLKAIAMEPNIAPITGAGFYTALNQAVELDPDFALAHATLAFAYGRAIGNDDSTRLTDSIAAHEALVREHAQNALDIDPAQSMAYAALAMLEASYYRMDEAESYWQKAIEVNPNDIEMLDDAAIFYASTGQLNEAIRLQNLIDELDPAIGGGSWFFIQFALGNFQPAATFFYDLAPFLPPSIKSFILSYGGLAAALAGNVEMAQDMLYRSEQFKEADPAPNSSTTLTAYAYARAGLTDDAERLAKQIVQYADTAEQNDQILIWHLVLANLALGDQTNALHWLSVMVNNPGPKAGSDNTIPTLVDNHYRDPVLDQPEFVAVRDKLRLKN